ncbi:unnamed protein product [Discosporangium mesarthrocarpum]
MEPEVPYRIHDSYGPDAAAQLKFIVVLREPVARTISSWMMQLLNRDIESKDARNFEHVVSVGIQGAQRLAACYQKSSEEGFSQREMDTRRCNAKLFLGNDIETSTVSHVAKSMYAMQLERWISVFGTKNIKVIMMEDMVENPLKTLLEVFNFIGVGFIDRTRKNGLASREEWQHVVKAAYGMTDVDKAEEYNDQVTSVLKAKLAFFFEPYNKELTQKLGVTLSEPRIFTSQVS